MNFASSPMNLTVLFFVSMLIWSFFRICKHTNTHVLMRVWVCGLGRGRGGTYVEAEVSFQHGAEVLGNVTHAGVQRGHQTGVEGQEVQPEGAERWNSVKGYHSNSAARRLPERSTLTRVDRRARRHRSHDPHLCLGTVKSARTSFLLLALVFMFMQKSMAALRRKATVRASAQTQGFLCSS